MKPALGTIRAQALADHMRKVVYPLQIVADDIKPEKAKELIVQQRGALAIISAEGTFFAILAGRYSDSPSLEVMLNGHAGEPITVDRVGRPALYTPRGCLTIAVACQPASAQTRLDQTKSPRRLRLLVERFQPLSSCT